MDFMMQAVELFYDFRDECAAFIFTDRLAALCVAGNKTNFTCNKNIA
jgi:hypothetical protein